MTKLIENDPVKTLFQDEELPARYDVTIAKILNDKWILVRVQDLMARHFAAVAIAQSRENEFNALKKRISLLLNPPAPIPSRAEFFSEELPARAAAPKPAGFKPAAWSLKFSTNDYGEKVCFLAGKCGRCGQEAFVYDAETPYMTHCGAVEAIPEEFISRLRQAPKPKHEPVEYRPAGSRVGWYVDTVAGEQVIVAEVPNDEKQWFSGSPKDAAKFVFRGETCPAHVIAEYARGFAA